MAVVDWASPILAFVGGGAGSYLTFRAARSTDEQTETAARRDEWGRRFTSALADFSATDVRQQDLGRTMIRALLSSELATADDRALATQVLTTDATRGGQLRTIVASQPANVRFVQDDGDGDGI